MVFFVLQCHSVQVQEVSMHLPVARRGVPAAQREHLHTGWRLVEQKQQSSSKDTFFLFTGAEGKLVVTTLS